jgi:hypothetical protein
MAVVVAGRATLGASPSGASISAVSLCLVLFYALLNLRLRFFFSLMLEPCNFVALVMKFGQKPLVEKNDN